MRTSHCRREESGEVCFVIGVDDSQLRLGAVTRIHTHIKRGVLVVRESPSRDIELWAGNAQIEQESIHPRHLCRAQKLVKILLPLRMVGFLRPRLGSAAAASRAMSSWSTPSNSPSSPT